MKILVVDDNATNRKFLRVLLMQEGHTVLEVEDGVEALNELQQGNIDAVISDILMPRMDGYRLCYEIRKNPILNPVPFIAYTATYTSPQDEKVALDFGADSFLIKPALPEVIIKALHEAIEKRGRRTTQFRIPDELSAMKEYSQTLVRKLEDTNAELSEANRVLNERAVVAEFNADIGNALNHSEALPVILQLCTEAMVRHLNAAFARIWTYNPKDNVLELQASAGMYTHINDGHARVPVGQFKIGLIASERRPHLTNSVIGDPRVNDQEWAKREGMVSFAGYPLIVEERLVGVMGMFAKQPIGPNTLHAMESVANGIALGIERKVTANELHQSNERFREIAENIREIFFIAGPDGTPVHYVSPAFEEISGRSRKGFECNPGFWLESIHPDDRDRVVQAYRAAPQRLSGEYRMVRPDGSIRWIHTRTFPVQDKAGKTVRLVGIAEDVTDRKRADEKVQQNLERIRAIHEIATAISSTLDLRTVLSVLLDKIELFLPIASAATVRLLTHETGELESLACRGLDENEWKLQQVRSFSGRGKRIVETKAPLAVRDIQGDPRTYNAELFGKHRLVSYLGVPLIAKENVLGVLGLYTNEEHDFTDAEVEFLMTLAGQAAIAIHNAQLYEQITFAKKQLETSNQYLERSLQQLSGFYSALTPIAAAVSIEDMMAGIIDRFITATGADAVSIRLLDKNRGTLPIIAQRGFSDEYVALVGTAPAGGAVSWVVRQGEAIIASDIANDARFKSKAQLQSGLRSCAVLPLPVHGQVRGVFHISSRTPGYFDEKQRDHLTAIARQMSIALENHELFDGLKSSSEELQRANASLTEHNRMLSALHEMAEAASQSLDLERVLHAAIDKVKDIFGFDTTRIHLVDEQTGDLVLRASFEKDPDRFMVANSFKKGQGIVGKVVESGTAMIFEDTAKDLRYREMSQSRFLDQFGFRFITVLPIKSKSKSLGTLTCVGRAQRQLKPGEFQLLEALAGQLAVAVENSSLYQKVLQNVRELQEKSAELEAANKVKDDFLALISHELRTPLNVIMGYVWLLYDGTLGSVDDSQSDALKKIQHQSRALLKMVDSILDVTLLEARREPLDNREVSVDTLLAEVKADCAAPAHNDLRLVWDCPPELPVIKTDAKKLKRILENLIHNALKFTNHGRITVSARLCGEPRSDAVSELWHPPAAAIVNDRTFEKWLELKVADTGVGIPSEALPHVFNRFYQVDSSATRAFGGMGLGLFVAKEFTKLLGGSIEAESAVGSGSTFTIKLPCE